MDFLIWGLFGLVCGLVAAYLETNEWLEGSFVTVIGILGGVCFGAIGRAAGLFKEGEALGIAMAIIGAVASLVFYCALIRPMFPAPSERSKTGV